MLSRHSEEGAMFEIEVKPPDGLDWHLAFLKRLMEYNWLTWVYFEWNFTALDKENTGWPFHKKVCLSFYLLNVAGILREISHLHRGMDPTSFKLYITIGLNANALYERHF